MDFFNRITERFIEANRKLRKLHRVVSVLAAIVVFATTYALILPAITLDQDTASAQSGIEVAASDHETDSGGGVYEEEPEEESDEDGSGGQQDEEILSEDSDSQGEDISDDDDPGRDTEPEQGQNTDAAAVYLPPLSNRPLREQSARCQIVSYTDPAPHHS